MHKIFSLTIVILLTACTGMWGGADVGTRYIALRSQATGETFAGYYATDGSYDRAALRQINQLMRDSKTGEAETIDPQLLNFVTDIRSRLALPETVVIEVLSAYRSPERNALLAASDPTVARESWHTKGKALDFRIAGVGGKAIAEIAKTAQKGGVAYYSKTNHVHVDIGGIRSWAGK